MLHPRGATIYLFLDMYDDGNNLNFIEMCQYFLKISLKNTCILLAKISPYVYLEFLPLAAEAGSRFNFCFKF